MTLTQLRCLCQSLAVTLFVVLLVGSSPCQAGSGGTIKLPTATNKKVKNGIIADLDSRWTNGWGYRPLKIKLSVRKSKAERNIRVVLLPESQYRGPTMGTIDPLSVSTEVTIPQGEKSVTKTVYLPQQQPWSMIRAEFFEDGRKLKDLSMDWAVGWPQNFANNYDNNSPCVLFVDKDAPKLEDDRDAVIKKLKRADSKQLPDAVKFEFLGNNYYMRRKINKDFFLDKGRANDDDSLTTVREMGYAEILPPSDLPTEALGLAGIDLIIIPIEELTDLADNDSERFHAIDFFIRNGGNLIVFGLNDPKGSVSKLLNREHDWLPANEGLFPEDVDESYDELVTSVDEADIVDQMINRGKSQKSKVPDDVPVFHSTSHGLGKIVAIEAEDPYYEAVAYWQWVIHQIGTERLTWTDRHGISLISNNNDYWDFMIPGYGASPVEGFLGVITLFILLIGPLNFYLLKKFKRLYLLPLTVVAAALLTTITMMCYAVVSDGVATRVRLRSFTLLDQQDDEHVAMTRCRHSYLAAISPSDGLVFPKRTCVYPILPFVTGSEERGEKHLDRANKRVLASGYIRSRTTTQFLTTNVEPTEHGIDDTAKGQLNNLGVDLTHIWICDENGEFAYANDVATGAPLNLEPQTAKDAMMAVNKLLSENRPSPPEGLDKTNNNNFLGMGTGRNRWSYYQNRPAYTTTSLLSANVKAVPKFFREAKPKTYIAFSSKAPPFVHQGTEATEEAGFHVVRGGY